MCINMCIDLEKDFLKIMFIKEIKEEVEESKRWKIWW